MADPSLQDSDGDGLSNSLELYWGLDPKNPNDLPLGDIPAELSSIMGAGVIGYALIESDAKNIYEQYRTHLASLVKLKVLIHLLFYFLVSLLKREL